MIYTILVTDFTDFKCPVNMLSTADSKYSLVISHLNQEYKPKTEESTPCLIVTHGVQ